MADPANSITWPVPPAVPILPMIARMTSWLSRPSKIAVNRSAYSSPASGSMSASPAHARPRMCQCQRQGAKSTMCRRVRVTTDNGHARLGESCSARSHGQCPGGYRSRQNRERKIGCILRQRFTWMRDLRLQCPATCRLSALWSATASVRSGDGPRARYCAALKCLCLSLREQGAGRYISDRYHHPADAQHAHPRFYQIVFLEPT